jgi:hypothetical protein
MILLEELEPFKGGGGGGGGGSGGGRGGSSRRNNKSSESGGLRELSKSINYFAAFAFAFLVVMFFLPTMFFNTKKK